MRRASVIDAATRCFRRYCRFCAMLYYYYFFDAFADAADYAMIFAIDYCRFSP